MTVIPLRSPTAFASSSYKTPFGIFDDDTTFRSDADAMVEYVRRRLGGATVTTEITQNDVWACFEDATLEFHSYVSIYQARDLMMDMIGQPSASLTTVQTPHHTTRFLQHYSAPYNWLGDAYSMHSGSITMAASQQHADLRADLISNGKLKDGDILHIKDVYYASNIQVYRLFNTTSAMNYLNREFNFNSYIPEVMFYLLPVWEDVLRVQEFAVSDKVRRANFSWRVNNGVLTVYPALKTSKTIWYTYQVEPIDAALSGSMHYQNYLGTSGTVTNVSNAPLEVMPYMSLNRMSKQFIKRITLAVCKELLGRVRSKYMSIPIPDGEVTLDGADLRSEASAELDMVRGELKEWLESLTHTALLTQEQEKQDAIYISYQKTPLRMIKG